MPQEWACLYSTIPKQEWPTRYIRIGIVDHDGVELSTLQRRINYSESHRKLDGTKPEPPPVPSERMDCEELSYPPLASREYSLDVLTRIRNDGGDGLCCICSGSQLDWEASAGLLTGNADDRMLA